MKTIYIKPAIGLLFIVLGIFYGLNAKRQTALGNVQAGRVRFKLFAVFLVVGMGLWIWYLK